MSFGTLVPIVSSKYIKLAQKKIPSTIFRSLCIRLFFTAGGLNLSRSRVLMSHFYSRITPYCGMGSLRKPKTFYPPNRRACLGGHLRVPRGTAPWIFEFLYFVKAEEEKKETESEHHMASPAANDIDFSPTAVRFVAIPNMALYSHFFV